MTARILSLKYPTPSEVASEDGVSHLRIALEGGRSAVGVTGRVRQAELFRDALLTTLALRDSDLRYKGKDRTAYLAFLMKKGKRATAAIWEAQKQFLESAYADETPRQRGLDPIWTVDPDEVSLEVFSRDESAYARLAIDNSMLADRAAAHGTTLADLSPAVAEQIQRIRTYQPLELEAETRLAGRAPPPREIELPNEWLRGFLQVQSAATLPAVVAELAPIDLYDVLTVLRLRKSKKAPRALRFELVPGARPRLVLEPWEIVVEGHGPVFRGPAPRVVRVYGRQRLLALAPVLAHVKRASVQLLGHGLPAFWMLDLGAVRLSIALTSWSESSWASAASFDALVPRAAGGDAPQKAVALLGRRGPLALDEIARELGTDVPTARSVLQRACLDGRVLFDLATRRYRPRALLAEPVDPAAIRYGSAREAAAHRLLGEGLAGEAGGKPAGEVRIVKVHVIAGEGQEIHGEVVETQARRTFSPRFTLDIEGQVSGAWCNCPTYQRSGLREGPCEHMLALHVFRARALADAERLRATPEGRKLVRAETRTLLRRDASGAQTTYRVSLDDRSVHVARSIVEPGRPGDPPRWQRLWFDTDVDARVAYFARLDRLGEEGFIDADALVG